MKRNIRKVAVDRVVVQWICLALLGCGQSDLVLPDSTSSGVCGTWYVSSHLDAGNLYGFEEGDTLPCAVFESARLVDGDTYINLGAIYLDGMHDQSDAKSVVLLVSAENCPSCAVLIRDLADNADRIDAAKAVMINVTFCNNIDRTDCDFDLERAASVAIGEGWPARWFVTNDEEEFLRPSYKDSFPTVIVARISDMKVISVDRTASSARLIALLETL